MGFFRRGDRVLAAVSGGADSLAMLHALAGARGAAQLELAAVHLHHGIRGEEADADEAWLEQICDGLGVALVVERADVPALARGRRLSIEEAGRIARYDCFARVARERASGWWRRRTTPTTR